MRELRSEYFGVRRQSEAATALWIGSNNLSAHLIVNERWVNNQFKVLSRIQSAVAASLSRRTPKKWDEPASLPVPYNVTGRIFRNQPLRDRNSSHADLFGVRQPVAAFFRGLSDGRITPTILIVPGVPSISSQITNVTTPVSQIAAQLSPVPKNLAAICSDLSPVGAQLCG